MARAVQSGPEILSFLEEATTKSKLQKAADEGRVPLAAISAELIERFGLPTLDTRVAKQFLGLASAAVLEGLGYEIAKVGVRVRRDPLFGAGAVYKPAPSKASPSALLNRILDVLTEDELTVAADHIARRLQHLRSERRRG